MNAEVEPSVAVNPMDSSNLIAAWQQDRWSDGGAHAIVTATSYDAGKTWSLQALPFSVCSGGTLNRASDPWLAFSSDGVAYEMALTFTGGIMATGSTNAMQVSRSLDGGTTWESPITLLQDGALAFNDKGSISADATDPQVAYAVWDRLDSGSHGPTLMARTRDAGASWEPARVIFDPGPDQQTLNNQIVVLPNGTVINFFTRIHTTTNASNQQTITASLEIIRSFDQGDTWSAPILISDIRPFGTQDPDTHVAIRGGALLGSIAVAPNGTLWVAWQDSLFGNMTLDSIAVSSSIDGGATWSTPQMANGDATVAAFTPIVAVLADGTVGVAYYDLRDNTTDPATLPTDFWLATSTDGMTWTDTLVSGPFDLDTAPNASGLFLGDYYGLAALGNAFLPLFARTTGTATNPTDVYITASPITAVSSASTARLEQIPVQTSRPGSRLSRRTAF